MSIHAETTTASGREIAKSPTTEAERKRQYFAGLAGQYRREMRVLFRGGRLKKSRDQNKHWRNVAEHCLAQLAAAEELCALLHLPQETTRTICSTSAIHDWDKRLERTGDRMSDAAPSLLQQVPAPDALLSATKPDFLERAYVGHETMSELQELQLYLDMMTRGSEIVPIDERLDEVEKRSPELAVRAGGQYWQRTRDIGHKVERRIFEQLKKDGIALSSQDQVPLFIRQRIEAHWTNV